MNQSTKMLQSLNEKFDHTRMGLEKVDNRLGELVAEMSFCKLWTVVVVEVILLILIVSL